MLFSGLEENGNTVNTIAQFTVETFAAGRADLEILILTAGGVTIPVSDISHCSTQLIIEECVLHVFFEGLKCFHSHSGF